MQERNIIRETDEEEKKGEKKKRTSLISMFLGGRGKKPLFSVPLDQLPLDETEKIPRVIVQLATYLRKNGIDAEGIFRVSGATREVLEMRKRVERESETGLDLSEYPKPHTIATLFKQFFSLLPEPIFTFDLHAEFIGALNDDPKVTVTQVRAVLNKLPVINLRTANFLFKFLAEVSANSSQNKMGPSNLALIFAPNILRPQTQVGLSMFDTTNCQLVELIITEYNAIFSGQWKSVK